MQIILLSGGSGKRLWPLSNDSRSKQFLPLLETQDGKRESMLQRVVRQLNEAEIDAELTIASNATQRDIILSQLGDKVSVVSEPERRDTFPAIALACAYLAFEKACSRDETVVVMPCDPYTEVGYFKAIETMASCVEEGIAELLLMGIEPSYPSSKYGYIVPDTQSDGAWSKVKKFTEKPDRARAEELLKQGAWWNAGVFAFRLGYLMDIMEGFIKTQSFEYTLKNYALFPVISFDYQVVEKAASIAAVVYSGTWEDLGTWNSLCERISFKMTGSGVLGDNVTNTHIINELDIPIICSGIDNAVVVACPEGILVCSKEEAEHLKSYVEKLA